VGECERLEDDEREVPLGFRSRDADVHRRDPNNRLILVDRPDRSLLVPRALIAAAVANALADRISIRECALRECLADDDLVNCRLVHIVAVEQAAAHKRDPHLCEVCGRHRITERARLVRTRRAVDLPAVFVVLRFAAASPPAPAW
jgi:hypothetical protein